MGRILQHSNSELLQEKVRRFGCALAGAMAQGTGSFLVPYHLKISNVIVLYFSFGTALCTALPGLPAKGDLDG